MTLTSDSSDWLDLPDAWSPHHARDLRELLGLTRTLVGMSDLDSLLRGIAEVGGKLLGCDRASVFLHDPVSDELYIRIAEDMTGIRFPSGKGIAGASFRTGAVIRIADVYEDNRFNPAVDRETGYRTRDLISCPLMGLEGKPVGVLQCLNKHVGTFDEWDEYLVRTLGAMAGVAVQRQMLIDATMEKARMQRDLQIARRIQESFLPRFAPTVSGYDLAGWNRPADETGGDYFDFLELDHNRIAIMLADISGHGIGSALIASECRAYMRAVLSQTQVPDQALTQVNVLLSANLPDDRFATLCLAILEPDNDQLPVISAGHGPIVHLPSTGQDNRVILPQGLPLGVASEIPYVHYETVTLGDGDLLVILTDGFHEAYNARGEAYGLDRVIAAITRHREQSAADIIARLREDFDRFRRNAPQADDLTVLVIKRRTQTTPNVIR